MRDAVSTAVFYEVAAHLVLAAGLGLAGVLWRLPQLGLDTCCSLSASSYVWNWRELHLGATDFSQQRERRKECRRI
jgi:hypothetical protein